jgi:hypothetical protein
MSSESEWREIRQHHRLIGKASLNDANEHRLEAYATLTPSRGSGGRATLRKHFDKSLDTPESNVA